MELRILFNDSGQLESTSSGFSEKDSRTEFYFLHTLHTLTHYPSDNQRICLVYAAIILVYATNILVYAMPFIISILKDP